MFVSTFSEKLFYQPIQYLIKQNFSENLLGTPETNFKGLKTLSTLKDFKFNVSEIEANIVLLLNYKDNIFIFFEDSFCYKDFYLYLKMLKIEKIKSRLVDIKSILVELDIKYTNLIKLNK